MSSMRTPGSPFASIFSRRAVPSIHGAPTSSNGLLVPRPSLTEETPSKTQ